MLLHSNSFLFFAGHGIHDVSFSGLPIKGSFKSLSTHTSADASLSLNDSWALYNLLVGNDAQCHCPSSIRNPNKAVCTINARTTQVCRRTESVTCFVINSTINARMLPWLLLAAVTKTGKLIVPYTKALNQRRFVQKGINSFLIQFNGSYVVTPTICWCQFEPSPGLCFIAYDLLKTFFRSSSI